MESEGDKRSLKELSDNEQLHYFITVFTEVKEEYKDEIPDERVSSFDQLEYAKLKCRTGTWGMVNFYLNLVIKLKIGGAKLIEATSKYREYMKERGMFKSRSGEDHPDEMLNEEDVEYLNQFLNSVLQILSEELS